MKTIRHNRKQQGSSLIEVLIALLIFTVGLLGLAGLQLSSLQSTADSSQRSQSTWLMQDLIERMRANSDGTSAEYSAAPACNALPARMCADYYDPDTSAKVNASNCNASQMATFDAWEAQCSYAALPAFNTIDARFSSRDFIIPPEVGSALTADASGNNIDVSISWLSKSSGKAKEDGNTSVLRIQR